MTGCMATPVHMSRSHLELATDKLQSRVVTGRRAIQFPPTSASMPPWWEAGCAKLLPGRFPRGLSFTEMAATGPGRRIVMRAQANQAAIRRLADRR